jgi:hypothetical protein
MSFLRLPSLSKAFRPMRTGKALDTPPEVVKRQALAEEYRPEVSSVHALTEMREKKNGLQLKNR